MLGFGVFDIYMICTILGAGYVVVSALLGSLQLGGEAGGADGADVGGHDLGHGGDFGHGGADAGGGDVGHDLGHDTAHDTGMVADASDEDYRAFSPLSPTIVASFMASFGTIGLVLNKGYDWQTVSVVPAGIGGLVFARLLMGFFNKLGRAGTSSSHEVVRELIGTPAEVTTPIGADTLGTITYVVRGARFSRAARSANGQPIARGQAVTIEAIDGNDTYVIQAE